MILEAYKNIKLMMTATGKTSGHTFSKVNPESNMEDVFTLARGISGLKKTKYDDFYYITETCLIED